MKAWATSLVVLLLAACTGSLASAPVTSSSSAPPLIYVEADPQGAPHKSGEGAPVSKIRAGECPAEVADFPEPYLRDRVLMRLPTPVTYEQFVDTAPDRVQLLAPVLLPTCKHAVRLESMTFTLLDPDPGHAIEALRDDVLSALGLHGDGTLIEAEVDSGREAEWVFETSSHKRLVVVRAGGGKLGVLTFEVASADWSLVVNSLRESGKKVTFIRNQ